MAEDRRYTPADVPVTAEDVAHRGFSTTFRGFDPHEVRQYLARVAESLRAARDRQRELEQHVREIESRAASPVLDEATLTTALGEHTARIIRSAHEAAADIRNKAEESVEHILRDAHEEAARLRAEAERTLADRMTEAEAEANGVRQAAEADAQGVRRRTQEQTDRLLERSRAQSKDVLAEAGALRNRVMGDLMRKRRVALSQVEQLQAGRDRLLEAYRIVRRTLDEATEALERAEADARSAAEAAAHRVAAEPEPTPDELGLSPVPTPPVEAAAPEPEVVVEAEPSPAPTPGTEPEPAPVYSRPPDTISSVRVLRPEQVPQPAPPESSEPVEVRPTLKVVQPPSDVESVRVFRADSPPPPEPKVEEAEPEPEPEPEVAEPEVAEPEVAEPEPVGELFAKLRAEQEAPADEAVSPEPDEPESDEPEPDALIDERNTTLTPIIAALTRKLKRALQDEQNEVLDRIRRFGHRPSLDAAFPADVDARARYREAARPHLIEAATAGVASAGGARTPIDDDVIDGVIDELADALHAPLARRIGQALEEATSLGEDDAEIVARVSAAYRDLKGGRLERLAGDHAGNAYAAGRFLAFAPGTPLVWVVDDVDGECPDCDDNALAGPTPRGESFPTGQLRPPAHAGCRCLLAPASA